MNLTLTYHAIRPAIPLCPTDDPVYSVSRLQFLAQLARIFERGDRADQISFSFDDGNASDLTAAALLKERGFTGTFFICWKNVGRGISKEAIQQLHADGFEIGAHGMTHRYLTDLSQADLEFEILESKDRLEQLIGYQVNSFAYPGGRFGKRVMETVAKAGFTSAFTTLPGLNDHSTDSPLANFRLKRIVVRNTWSMDLFEQILNQDPKTIKRLATRDRTLFMLKRTLGNNLFDRFRSIVIK